MTNEQVHATNKNQNLKAILNYCLRVLIFILLSRYFVFDIMANIFEPILSPFLKGQDFFEDVANFVIILLLFHDYIAAKICGLFKKLDDLNIFYSLIIIVAVDVIRSYSWMINVQITPSLKINFYKNDFVILMFMPFLLYRFFYFLTKKFPIPFEKIRYYTSIEFYINFVKRLLKR